MPCKDPNCEYCKLCVCGHKSDEHMCGDGPCYECNCSWFSDPEWIKANPEQASDRLIRANVKEAKGVH